MPGAETDDHGIDTTLYKLQVDTFMASSADGFLMVVKMHPFQDQLSHKWKTKQNPVG